MPITNRNKPDGLGELSLKYTTCIEDVLYSAKLTEIQIGKALRDEKFFYELTEFFRNKFGVHPF